MAACAATAGLLGVMLAGCTDGPPTTIGPVTVLTQPPVTGTPYTIQSGDTLYSIADSQGVSWRDLMAANPNVNWQAPQSGQVILIPGGRKSPLVPVTPPPPAPGTMTPGHPGPIAAEDHFVWPLRGDILVRFHQPVAWRMHGANQGVDIAAQPGAAVVAAKSGHVNTFTHADDDGKLVILEHQDQTVTCYGHLGEILVKHDTWVKQGEVIGTAGTSGRARGTELSFRIFQNDHYVDPLPLLAK